MKEDDASMLELSRGIRRGVNLCDVSRHPLLYLVLRHFMRIDLEVNLSICGVPWALFPLILPNSRFYMFYPFNCAHEMYSSACLSSDIPG